MGLETAALIFSVISAGAGMMNASAEAKATIKEGNIVASNKAKETQLKAAKLQSSFLSSGLTLEGTPGAAAGRACRTGMEDIEQIRSNYNTKAENIISSGRLKAITTLAAGFAGADVPGLKSEWGMPMFSPIGEVPGGPAIGLSGQNTWNWQK